jgi:hypothetical protein
MQFAKKYTRKMQFFAIAVYLDPAQFFFQFTVIFRKNLHKRSTKSSKTQFRRFLALAAMSDLDDPATLPIAITILCISTVCSIIVCILTVIAAHFVKTRAINRIAYLNRLVSFFYHQ